MLKKVWKIVQIKILKLILILLIVLRRKYSVFIGETALSNIYNEQQTEYWITKQDWDEFGPDIIFKKCQNIIL